MVLCLASGVVEASEGTARSAPAAHVGGRLVGVAGDAVEQDAVWLRRQLIAPFLAPLGTFYVPWHVKSPRRPFSGEIAQDRAHVEEGE